MRPRRLRSLHRRAPVHVVAAVRRLGAIARTAIVTALVSAISATGAVAQDVAKEGALFLLVPIGARAVGQGQAAVASRLGGEAIWWNPAALGWSIRREFTIDYSKNFLLTGTAANAVFPAGKAGVLSASLLHFNFGDQLSTDQFGATIGTLYSKAAVLATSYSATFGDRVSVGLTYKYLQQSQSCGGSCQGVLTYLVSTSAFDFGAHVVAGTTRALTVGAVARNVGFCIQVIDTEQCDPVPARLHAGADYRIDAVSRAAPGLTLHFLGEVVSRLGFDDAAFRAGAEFGVAERYFLRGGILTASGDGSTAAVGLGVRQGALGLEFARTFGGLSSDAGEPPTYLTVRFIFR